MAMRNYQKVRGTSAGFFSLNFGWLGFRSFLMHHDEPTYFNGKRLSSTQHSRFPLWIGATFCARQDRD